MSMEKPPEEKPPDGYREDTRGAWDARFERGWQEGARPARFLVKFIEANREKLGKDVLDLGCGNGRNLLPLAKDPGFSATGLDLSAVGLEKAKNALAQAKTEAKLVQGESTALPFKDDSFDFVVSIGAIHHNTWENIQKSFQEAGRVLRDGQYFLFQGRSINDTDRPRTQVEDPDVPVVPRAYPPGRSVKRNRCP